jgi:FG-GAP-like repeat
MRVMTMPDRLTPSLLALIIATTVHGQCLAPFQDLQRKMIDQQLVSIASGDVDHDGVTDIVLLGAAGTTLYHGLPNGGFEDGRVVSTRGVEQIALADVNGDGNLDIILAGATVLSVNLGDGHGGFTERFFNNYNTLTRLQAIVAGRFTGSGGKVDLLATDEDGAVVTFKGHGDGTFDAPVKQSFTVGSAGAALRVDDLDRDGNDDVVLVEYPPVSGVTILHNKGNGTFEKTIAAAGSNVLDVSVADLNGDGIDDFAVVINSTLAVVRGLGSLQYAAPVTLNSVRVPPLHVLAADVNGDGNVDLITDDQEGSTLVVAYGKGDGTFPNVIASDAAPVPLSALIAGKAGAKSLITTIGYTSGEMVTWQMVCEKRRSVRSR